MVQFFFGCACVLMVMFMLAVMAYEQFVAVGKPLLYTVAMSPKLCALLVAVTYMWGALCSLTITYSLVQLSYCESNIINHFTCEYSEVLAVSCSSPLTAITIFHGTILLLFCAPNATTSWVIVKVASVFYRVVIAMPIPLIYSLRNKDVKDALRKFVFIKSLCHVT
ncbi:Olfactory receptor 5D13 [Heterocephalus glaber]|uniref:Olfactory receptor 5D13 n=1 Tax=Heterocephalus glaber TaxID=10181 RepID=G5BP62_HETGA|nr:Olfactory receptor 5D13 [Heterocephalus glaber]